MASFSFVDKLYAALLAFSTRGWSGDSSTASYLTAFAIGGALVANVLLILLLLSITTDLTLRLSPSWGLAVSILLVALAGYIVYRAFLRGGRHEELHRRFLVMPQAHRRPYLILALTYLLLSYGVPAVLAFYAAGQQ